LAQVSARHRVRIQQRQLDIFKRTSSMMASTDPFGYMKRSECCTMLMGLIALLSVSGILGITFADSDLQPTLFAVAGVAASVLMCAAAMWKAFWMTSGEKVPRTTSADCRRVWASCQFDKLQSSSAPPFQYFSIRHGQSSTEITPVRGVRVPSPAHSARAKDGDVCHFCLDAFEPQSQVAVLPCGHVFHETCIAAWSLVSSRNARACPVCRDRYDRPRVLGVSEVV